MAFRPQVTMRAKTLFSSRSSVGSDCGRTSAAAGASLFRRSCLKRKLRKTHTMLDEMLSKEPMKYALIDEESNGKSQRTWRYRLGIPDHLHSEAVKPWASVSWLSIVCLFSVLLNLAFIFHWSRGTTDNFWSECQVFQTWDFHF